MVTIYKMGKWLQEQNRMDVCGLGSKSRPWPCLSEMEAAYAKSYQIQFSNDEENWTTVYTKGNGSGSEETPEEQLSLELWL